MSYEEHHYVWVACSFRYSKVVCHGKFSPEFLVSSLRGGQIASYIFKLSIYMEINLNELPHWQISIS